MTLSPFMRVYHRAHHQAHRSSDNATPRQILEQQQAKDHADPGSDR